MAEAILEPVDVEAPGYDEALAMSQGWLLADNSDYGIEIERYGEDPQNRFHSDAEALAFVASLANAGDAHAIRCLANVAANIEYSAQVTARTEEWEANAAYCGECGMTHLPEECTNEQPLSKADSDRVRAEATRLYADDDTIIEGRDGSESQITETDTGYWVEARVWVPKQESKWIPISACLNCGDPQHVHFCDKPPTIPKAVWQQMDEDQRNEATRDE